MVKTMGRRLTVIVMALAMVFAMSASVFAGTGTATMKYYMPTSYTNIITEETETPTIPSYYTDSSVSGMKGVSADVDLSTITDWQVTTPTGFQGLYNYDSLAAYIPTAFDVLYVGGIAKGETAAEETASDAGSKSMNYGFDTYSYSDSGVAMH